MDISDSNELVPSKIMSDRINRWVFSHTGEAYLVGGYVRDMLLRTSSYRGGELTRDKDYAVRGDADEFARNLANEFSGTFIVLQKKTAFRIALPDGSFVDITRLKADILSDLYQRDFTVNAIAWAPGRGITAPSHHLDDIRNGIIRSVRERNLVNDPLRILRAYRLSAQLGFEIELQTRSLLGKYAHRIKEVSKERITEELFTLLNHDNSFIYLELCRIDKVLSHISGLTRDILKVNINYIAALNRSLSGISKYHMSLHTYLCSEFSQGLTRAGLIRLFLLLLSDNPSLFHPDLQLRVSRKIIQSLNRMSNAHIMSAKRLTRKGMFEIFSRAGDAVYETTVILSLFRQRRSIHELIKMADNFIFVSKSPLLTGRDIADILHISREGEGILIGRIKTRLIELQFLGRLKSRDEAEEWIQKHAHRTSRSLP